MQTRCLLCHSNNSFVKLHIFFRTIDSAVDSLESLHLCFYAMHFLSSLCVSFSTSVHCIKLLSTSIHRCYCHSGNADKQILRAKMFALCKGIVATENSIVMCFLSLLINYSIELLRKSLPINTPFFPAIE